MSTDAPTIDPAHAGEFEHPDTVAMQAFGFWFYLMSDLIVFATLKGNLNIVTTSGVQGTVKLSLQKVTLGELLEIAFASVTDPTLPLFGSAAPLSTPAAFLSSIDAGGVLVMKVNERSA